MGGPVDEPPTSPPASLDEAGFDRWVEAFRGPLVGLLASWCSDWRLAEELAHDTFAEAWVGRARFTGDTSDLGAAGAWLRGIAFHLNAARLREAAQRPAMSEAALGPLGLNGVAVDARRAHVEGEGSARLVFLRAEFTELPAYDQTLLRMHYLERTTAREVAALLGSTPKAVEGRLYQVRRTLREMVVRAMHRAQREAER